MKTKEISDFRKTYKPYNKECYFEGLKLAVLFDEKDEVKKWGANWDVDGKFWWMPECHLTREIHPGIGTVNDWLNDHKMIVGQYGKFHLADDLKQSLFSSQNSQYTEYKLEKERIGFWQVRCFYESDVTTYKHFDSKQSQNGIDYKVNDKEYLTLEDGRNRWDGLITNGYNRVENS